MFSSNTAQLLSGALYIEDVFSTWLYAGNGSTQTINNGIDLAGKGGLVWIKGRSGSTGNRLTDAFRGAAKSLESNSNAAEATESTGLTAFSSTGFTIGADSDYNTNAATYTAWTFRDQAKFFDIVTYTGNGANRTIAHNLGSVPGCIIVKRTDAAGDWQVYHRSLANTQYLVLNSTDISATGADRWNSTTPTASVFSLGTNAAVNASGSTYVAYLFAHDAGGFGVSGADSVISCGSYTGNGSTTGPVVTLGYEPQWLLIKRTDVSGDWNLIDNMRAFAVASTDAELNPNLSNAESTGTFVSPTATGFQLNTTNAGYNASGGTYVYVTIRRGPMRTPTSGASVYENVAYSGNNTTQRQIGSSVLMDMALISNRTAGATDWALYGHYVFDRIRGDDSSLATASSGFPSTGWSTFFDSDRNVGWDTGSATQVNLNTTGQTFVSQIFRRAPGFFDVVHYVGSGVNRTVSHNLGVAPDLMLIKILNGVAADWQVYSSALTNTEYLVLNTTAAKATGATRWNSTTPTATEFSLGTAGQVNLSGSRFVAYLFGSCPGVSQVGSYTGTGGPLSIDCGFSAGARFVLIKRTDSTGDWLFWDTARGIVGGNDPYLRLNSTAAEVTNTDWVDPLNAGFQLSSAAGNNANINNATYTYLAIA